MTSQELKLLAKAEELFELGKLNDAYDVLNELNQKERLKFEQKSKIHNLMGLLLAYQNRNEELIKLGEEISTYAQERNKNLHYLDGLFFLSLGLGNSDKFTEALNTIEKAEIVIKDLPKNLQDGILQKIARINLVKAWANFNLGQIEESEQYIEKILKLEEKLGDCSEIIWTNLLRSQILMQVRFNLSLAMQCIKKAMKISKKVRFNHYWIGFSHIAFGVLHYLRLEYDISLEYYRKSLPIFRDIKNDWYIANILNNIGTIYCDTGEFELAQNYLEESLEIWEHYSLYKGACIDSLIYVALEIGDIEKAKIYLERLKDRFEEKKDRLRKILYLYNKAAILKTSTRIRNIAEAEKLFKQICETPSAYFDYKIYAYIHLCDILVTEYSLNFNSEVLDELNEYIPKLMKTAEHTHSYLIFCETFILQAKLALLNFDVKAAQRFLTQAQKVAESNGIIRLARKISYEHDKLIEQLRIWKKLRAENVPISERLKYAGLSEQMKIMKKKGLQGVPDLSDEKPVFLLIVSEGGMPFFSQSFTNDKNFEEHLFGGFFITLNSFIMQNFSEGLNRASFGEYTLLMNAFSPFLLCYIYRGQSYSAQKRIYTFLNEIKNNQDTWNSFRQFHQMNREIDIKDIPHLELLIQETFPIKSS